MEHWRRRERRGSRLVVFVVGPMVTMAWLAKAQQPAPGSTGKADLVATTSAVAEAGVQSYQVTHTLDPVSKQWNSVSAELLDAAGVPIGLWTEMRRNDAPNSTESSKTLEWKGTSIRIDGKMPEKSYALYVNGALVASGVIGDGNQDAIAAVSEWQAFFRFAGQVDHDVHDYLSRVVVSPKRQGGGPLVQQISRVLGGNAAQTNACMVAARTVAEQVNTSKPPSDDMEPLSGDMGCRVTCDGGIYYGAGIAFTRIGACNDAVDDGAYQCSNRLCFGCCSRWGAFENRCDCTCASGDFICGCAAGGKACSQTGELCTPDP